MKNCLTISPFQGCANMRSRFTISPSRKHEYEKPFNYSPPPWRGIKGGGLYGTIKNSSNKLRHTKPAVMLRLTKEKQ